MGQSALQKLEELNFNADPTKTNEAQCLKHVRVVVRRGDFDEAEKLLHEVLASYQSSATASKAIQREEFDVLCMLGLVYAKRGLHQLAIRQYDRALNLFPQDVDALFSCAVSHKRMKNLERAKAQLKLARRVDPGHLNTLAVLGDLLMQEEFV